MEVAGVGLGAALPALPGTGLAALTAICHQADAGWAARRGPWALARPPAVLAPCVGLCRGRDRAGHGEGRLGSDLQGKRHGLESVKGKCGCYKCVL